MATAVHSPFTRVIPARPANQAAQITKNENGSMDIQFGDGRTGNLSANDADLQAFVVWTMLQ